MDDVYSSLKSRVNNIIITKEYKINKQEHPNNSYEFYITKQDSSEKISSVGISIIKDNVSISNLREYVTTPLLEYIPEKIHTSHKDKELKIRKREITREVELFHVDSVNTKEKYAGNYFATFLLIYGISDLKLKYRHIKYAILDDCSDNSNYIEKNIYHRLGFVPQGDVSLYCPSKEPSVKDGIEQSDQTLLSDSGSSDAELEKLVLSGPEKQADLNIFRQKASDVLSKIESKTIEKGKAVIKKVRRKSRKPHKRRSRRNRRTHKK